MKNKKRWGRRLLWTVLCLLALLLITLAIVYVLARPSLGNYPEGDRLSRTQRSPQWGGESFVSGSKLWFPEGDRGEPAATASPPPAVRVVRTDPNVLRTVPATGLRLTWFGHSSTLVQIDGINVLTDPFWSQRTSPVPGVGPERWYAPPIELEKLPRIDAVVVSHDHYDHLDAPTIRALNREGTRFIVPLGVGAHLEDWGVPASRISELDWWESADVRGVRIHATPARHYSGRLEFQGNDTLWAGYALVGPRNRVYYTGDTSYMPEMVETGKRFGPFDLVLTDSGQYNPAWPDVHLGPEQAVELASAVGAKVMVPIHWGLVRLAYHPWPEPAERTLAAAACHGVPVLIPKPGQPVEPAHPPRLERWWAQVTWKTALQAPIRSSRNGVGSEVFEARPCKAAVR